MNHKHPTLHAALCALPFALCTLLASCHRPAPQSLPADTTATTPVVTLAPEDTVALPAVEVKQDTLHACHVEGTATINQKRSRLSSPFSLVFLPDSICILSLKPLLGMELFRMEMVPDEVVLVDKVHHQVAHVSYAELGEMTGMDVNFALLQRMLAERLRPLTGGERLKEKLLDMQAEVAIQLVERDGTYPARRLNATYYDSVNLNTLLGGLMQ